MVNESASKIEQDNTAYMILVTKDNRQGSLEGLSSLCLSYTPIKAYCTAVRMSGLVTGGGRGSFWHSVLYYWLIPNRNTKDGISIDIGWV